MAISLNQLRTRSVFVGLAGDPGFRGRRVSNFTPEGYIRHISDDLLRGGRTISLIASMSLGDVSRAAKISNEKAAKAIVACTLFTKGINIAPNHLDEIVGKLSLLLLYGDIWNDCLSVAQLGHVIGEKMGLPPDRLSEMWWMILHDIGKAAGKGADRMVEVSSAMVHGEYKKMTLEQATAMLYSKRDRIKENETINSFVGRVFEDAVKKDLIIKSLKKGFGLKETDPIRKFYDLHSGLGAAFLFGKVSDWVYKLIGRHHIIEDVDSIDKLPAKEVIRGMKRDPVFWTALKVHIFADKIDAYMRRGKVDHFQARDFFFKYIIKNHLVDKKEFTQIFVAFNKLLAERHPALVKLGIID